MWVIYPESVDAFTIRARRTELDWLVLTRACKIKQIKRCTLTSA